jgi:uncharacterized protein (TIGR03435 family)
MLRRTYAFLLIAITVIAQPQPAFEIASIKPTDPSNVGNQMFSQPGGRFRGINATLKSLIRYAYDVDDEQIIGASGWMESAGYDIAAKASDPNAADLRPMVRTLLADRFHLQFHNATRELPIYILSVSKAGAKLIAVGKAGIGVGGGKGRLNGKGADMATLARVLRARLGRVVYDRTGIGGFFDFQVNFAPDDSVNADTPSIFTALQEQLGLKLETQKGAVDVIIVDHADKPSDN